MTRETATRPYRMKKRAESQEQTRLRITESAVELHRTLGPSKTSMSAVAERAGVRRSTLYRHFPDEAALFDACSAHHTAMNPPPELGPWRAIADPAERLRAALEQLYAHYRKTESMLDNLYRDESLMPVVAERFARRHAYNAAAQETLMKGRGLRGAARRRVGATVGHAISFFTWKSLTREQGLGDGEALELMCALVRASEADPGTMAR